MTDQKGGYPPYDPEAECPKCHHDEVTTRYFMSRENGDGLHRCCERCGYGWNESTVDDRAKYKSKY